ncbi:RNA-binding RNA annealing protein [Rhizina undulata]
MSSKLDRSLDEILAERPRGGNRRQRGGPSASGGAPAGGIRKRSQRTAAVKANAAVTPNATKAVASGKPIPTGPSGRTGSKIIVSNLPYDVSEAMIKEYFTKVVGPIKRCVITYGPNGQSRGIATVEFAKSEDAITAAQKYNGVEVDKRPMKVELVVDPAAPPSFADRVGAPKAVPAPKNSASKPRPVSKNVNPQTARGRGGKKGGRGGRTGNGRGKPKTAEELDAEMADYFDNAPAGGASNAVAAPTMATTVATNGGDIGMDDDNVMVGTP